MLPCLLPLSCHTVISLPPDTADADYYAADAIDIRAIRCCRYAIIMIRHDDAMPPPLFSLPLPRRIRRLFSYFATRCCCRVDATR